MTTTAGGAQMAPDPEAEARHLIEVRRRRAELLESITALELALAAPGRQELWVERVSAALTELAGEFQDHVVLMEGPNGLNVRLIRQWPRLAHKVEGLTKEHAVLTGLIEEFSALVDQAQGSPERGESMQGSESPDDPMPGGWDEVRERGTHLLGALVRHRQRGADLVYEAYAVDIGGQD
jgi:hypothetical protein